MNESSCGLIEENLGLVEAVVRRLAAGFPRHVDRAELVSAGMLGLVEAAANYDPTRGVPFAPFAHRRISGAVLDHCRRSDWAPRSVRAAARTAEASTQEVANRLGRTPTTPELSAAMGITVDELGQPPGPGRPRGPREPRRSRTRSDDHGHRCLFARPRDPALTIEAGEQIAYLRDAVAVLPERHRSVIVGHFFEEIPDQEIASSLGVSTSRVSQLRSDAIEMMRDGIDAQFSPPPVARPVGRVARRKARYSAAIAASSNHRSRVSVDTCSA